MIQFLIMLFFLSFVQVKLTDACIGEVGLSVPQDVDIKAIYKRNAAFQNGHVFTGSDFQIMDITSVNGLLSFNKPEKLDTIIDVQGKYIIPPLGEAHNHTLADPRNFSNQMKRYLTNGIFYAKNLHYIHSRTMNIKEQVEQAQTIAVAYAHAGILATGGHAFSLYQNLFRWNMLCDATVKNIFPQRRIGKLQESYEASLLILNRNPLKEIEALSDIHLRFKQGFFLLLD